MEPSKVFSSESSVSDQNNAMPTNSTSSTSHTSAAVATGTDPSSENAASCDTSDAPNIVAGTLRETDGNKENQNIEQLSVSNANVSTNSEQTTTKRDENKVSAAFSEVLKIPVAKKTTKARSNRVQLPEAISGEKFHDLLVEKQKQKEEMNAQKEARKQEREERRQTKQKEQEKRAQAKKDKQILK